MTPISSWRLTDNLKSYLRRHYAIGECRLERKIGPATIWVTYPYGDDVEDMFGEITKLWVYALDENLIGPLLGASTNIDFYFLLKYTECILARVYNDQSILDEYVRMEGL